MMQCTCCAAIFLAFVNGTFTVYRNGDAVASGLTRDQAERCATVLGWIA